MPNVEEAAGEKLHNDQLNDLLSLPDIPPGIKSWSKRPFVSLTALLP